MGESREGLRGEAGVGCAWNVSVPAQTRAETAKGPFLRHSRQPWTPWFRAAGLALTEPARGLSFNDAGAMLQAAAQGHGIALARATLADDDLRAGRLLRLSDIDVADVYAWHAVWRQRADKMHDIAAFTAWLQEEFASNRFALAVPALKKRAARMDKR